MRTIFITPPDETKRRRGRRRWMVAGIATLLPQSVMMGGGGLRWLNDVASPGVDVSQMADQLFRAMLTGVTGIGLPVIAIACGVHFMKLGGNKVIGVAVIAAGPVVSVLSVLAHSIS